jgi:hypothetical protein
MSKSSSGIVSKALSLVSGLIIVAACVLTAPLVSALGSQQNPQSGTLGFEGTVPGNPPTAAATIAVPSSGQTFTSTPVSVSGLCQTGLLIKIFANNVFVGAVQCAGGSYSLQVDLFSGTNELVARDYDNLDQQGPDSNMVSVTFNDAQYAQFGSRVTLSSNYARQGVDPGTTLTWPLILSGGTGPYALSVDWGDGSGAGLKSVSFPGVVNVSHVYNQAGVYTIVAKTTDANNTSAYLQLVGVANGPISGALSSSSSKTSASSSGKSVIVWQPMVAALPVILIAFWLGRRHELYVIRRTIESSR